MEGERSMRAEVLRALVVDVNGINDSVLTIHDDNLLARNLTEPGFRPLGIVSWHRLLLVGT